MPTLYLSRTEQDSLQKLSAELRSGYTIEPETLTFEDTPERRAARLALLHVHHPSLAAFRQNTAQIKTGENFEKAARLIDFTQLPDEDIAELFFALGPDFVSAVIADGIAHVTSAEDMEALASFAGMRHALLQSLQPQA